MQVSLDNLHAGIEIITAIMVFGGFIVALMIKNNQATVKEELTEEQNKTRQMMESKYAEVKQDVAVHVAEDRLHFAAIDVMLQKMDLKLDSLNNRSR